MKITELIKELEKAKNSVGDVEVCTDGYFGTLEIEELKITTWGEKGRYMGKCYDEPDPTVLPQAANTSELSALLGEISAEAARACAKFPTWPTDPLHALAVLGEEYGELTKDMLQLCYEPHKTNRENVRKEAMQTAAMALRLAASLDRYDYRPGTQHSQTPNDKGNRTPGSFGGPR